MVALRKEKIKQNQFIGKDETNRIPFEVGKYPLSD